MIEAETGGQAHAPPSLTERQHGLNLFLTGFLVLFLELACIRWFSATVVFMQFFSNIVLLACFLGMSCGCMAARSRRDWLGWFPLLTLLTFIAALAMQPIYTAWSGLSIDVGNQASPQEIFFGTEYRNPDVAQFTVPIELIVGVFFVLIALMFVGIGQVLGRAFDAYPNRVKGYTLNIGGSLAGIAGFSLLSMLHAPPIVWFLVCCAGIAFLLRQAGGLTWLRGGALACILLLVTVPVALMSMSRGSEMHWSPYYAVSYQPARQDITVNSIGHQAMVPYDSKGSLYSLPHLLRKATGDAPFQDQLIIGAGSGNDVVHALRHGVGRIDAVEIDPAILRIGVEHNPDKPYADPRVTRHLDDGRHFLRTTGRKYDAVVYALVDSLILHSSYANLRLESYLFTEQAFSDIKRVLKPDGIFVTYNYFRQGWVVERVAGMAEKVFGCKPTVLSLPYRATQGASEPAGFTMIIAGCNPKIAEAFASRGPFWLNDVPPVNDRVDGFTVRPESLPEAEAAHWQRIAPSTIVHDGGTPRFATDDWPFLYLVGRVVPDLSIRSMLMIGLLGIGLVYLFLPKRGLRQIRFDGRMFFLGAAFMLLETKAIVQLALLFGSTWFVNSMVFFTALVLILLANLFVLKGPSIRMGWHYAGLLVLLAAAIATPFEIFLSGGVFMRYVVPCALALGPMFFAGVIFAQSFRKSADPDMAFGSNIAGSVLGGLAESFSTLLGFQYLLLVAVAFYLLSALLAPRRGAADAITARSGPSR